MFVLVMSVKLLKSSLPGMLVRQDAEWIPVTQGALDALTCIDDPDHNSFEESTV